MRPVVTYTPYATSSREKTGDVITFAQFEEGTILTETRNDAESGDKSDSESLMMNKQDMENLDSNEKSDHNLISDSSLLSVSLRVSVNMFPSSNCVNVITLPVYSFEDVAYGVYVTSGRIAIASEYGRDMYNNALEKLSSNTASYDDITFLVLGTYTRYPF